MSATKTGAELGRYYADMYPTWVALADRHGDLLFIRYGDHFITFGEHATIVAALVNQRPHTTPIGGGPEIGPVYVINGIPSAMHITSELLRGGHAVVILDPPRHPLTCDETFRPGRLVRLTEIDAPVATPVAARDARRAS